MIDLNGPVSENTVKNDVSQGCGNRPPILADDVLILRHIAAVGRRNSNVF